MQYENQVINFDYKQWYANCEFKNGYLHLEVTHEYLDETITKNISLENLSKILLNVKKEDFTEIFYECYSDSEENDFIHLVPQKGTFCDDIGMQFEVAGSKLKCD